MTFRLTLLPDLYAVCRLEPHAAVPEWVKGTFLSITRTPDELSIICEQDTIPQGVQAERSWRCLKIAGPLDSSAVGVVASLANTLAAADISVFVVSTFNTDYLLVNQDGLAQAIESLRSAGHAVS